MGAVRLFMNKHIAKLWDFMVSYNCKSEEQPSDILKAFQECDAALTELEEDRNHWKTMYGNACQEMDTVKEGNRILDMANRQLIAENEDQKKEIEQRRKELAGLYKSLDQLQEENEKLKNLHFDVVAVNHKTIDQLQKENETMKHVIDDFTRFADATNKSKRDAEKEIDELKKDCAYMTNSRDTWRSRAKHAEKEVEELNKQVEARRHVIDDFVTKVDELQKDRDRNAEAVVELAKKRDELQAENAKLKEETKWLRTENRTKTTQLFNRGTRICELQRENSKLWAENADLKKKDDPYIARLYHDETVYVWQALQRIFSGISVGTMVEFCGCSSVGDIVHKYSVDEFMDKYREFFNTGDEVEKPDVKEEHMRDFLQEFCDDYDSCRLCPLKECGSDLGSSFDSMSDEEIEKLYNIAIGAQPKKEKPDLKFGDIVKIPWSNNDYIFIEALTSSIRLYSITKRRFVIVAKNEHLKWVGHIKK